MKKKKNEDLEFSDFCKCVSKSSKLRYINYFNLQLKSLNSNKNLANYNSNINELSFNHFKNLEVNESDVIDLLFRIERENTGLYLRKSARNIDKSDNQTFKMISENKNKN